MIMRKYTYCLLLGAALASSSCDSYLETKTYGQVLPETTADYVTLLHTHLRDIEEGHSDFIIGHYNDFFKLECFSDNLNASLHDSKIKLYNAPLYIGSAVNTHIYKSQNLYARIKDANIVLDQIAGKDGEEEQKYSAVAYTMRGILYYNLLRDFCEPYDEAREDKMMGMPIAEEFDMEAKPGRGNIRALKEFIISDFEKAIKLNMTDKKYLLTADVAKAFMARTYFWCHEWEKAIKVAEDLLNRYPLVEGEEYVNMIQSVPPYETLPSGVIFASFSKGEASYNFKNHYSKYSRCRPLDFDLVNLFVEKGRDIRYAISFDKKFLNVKRLNSFVRSAEMYLIISEAYAHMGKNDKALKYLNNLRAKRISDYSPLTMNNLPAVDEKEMIKVDALGNQLTPLMSSILHERRKELYMEGDRWYELKRNGCPEFWVGNNGIKYTTERYLYTLPLWKLDLNVNPKLVQNAGYDKL